MGDVNARPFLFSAVFYLVVAVPLGLVVAVAPGFDVEAAFFSAVVFGFLFSLISGLVAFYMPTFVKRDSPLPILAYASLGAVHVGFIVLAASPFWSGAINLHLAFEGAALLLFVLHTGIQAALGARRASQKALHRSGGPYAEGDRLTIGTFTGGLLYLAIAGAYLLSSRLRDHFPVEAILVALLAGAFLQFAYAASFHLSPRAFKRPFPAKPAYAEIARWGVILHNFGVLGVLPAMVGEQSLLTLWMFAPLPFVGLAVIGILLAFTRARGESLSGRITRAADPYYLASYPLGLLGAVLFVFAPFQGGLLAPALALTVAAIVLAYAGFFIQLVPVIANAVPGDEALSRVAAFLGFAGGLLAAGAAIGFAPAWLAAIPAGSAVVVFLGQSASLRTPRRDCPPPAAPHGGVTGMDRLA